MSADPKDPEAQAGEDAWAEALAEQAETGQAEAGQPTADETVNAEQPDKPDDAYEKAAFDKLENAVTGEGGEAAPDLSDEGTLDVILDIPVTVSMEIGRTRLPIRNLLRLSQGSVVELDRLAGEPLDVLVNGTLIAHGEVVVVNEKYGIRLTDVISPAERVRKLK